MGRTYLPELRPFSASRHMRSYGTEKAKRQIHIYNPRRAAKDEMLDIIEGLLN